VTWSGPPLRELLRRGDRVVVAQGAGEPVELVRALRDVDVPDLEVFVGLSSSGLVDSAFAERVRLRSYAAMGSLRSVAGTGRLEIVPVAYADLPGLMSHWADVVLLQVSPPGDDGDCTLGPSVCFAQSALAGARVAVAEVNAQAPVTSGGPRLPAGRFTSTLATDRPLVTTQDQPANPVELEIGRHVVGLVSDGAAVQLGIGAVAAAIAHGLERRRNLRVHSALVGDWLPRLHAAGAIDAGEDAIRVGAALGSPSLYEFLDGNRSVRFGTIDEISSPAVLAGIPRLIAINSALQVDITGQVNAEILGERYLGGLGGQADFLRCGQLSPQGLSIVALPSTGAGGRQSRIVPVLDSGWVTTPRSSVDIVVTEHGVADLRGRSLRGRAERLIAVAAPEFRGELAAAHQHAAPYLRSTSTPRPSETTGETGGPAVLAGSPDGRKSTRSMP
jgi:acyl-CoA hydrolase